MSTSEIATVLAWHDALNDGDLDTLLQLSSDDVEIGAPQGAAQGLAALRDWADDAETTLTPGRMYVHHGVVVCEETATGGVVPDTAGEGGVMAIAFRVVEDHVVSVFVHPSIDGALAATGLELSDLVDS
ncbi:nuclear transport factor 2 family protein [Rhodococcus sp. D2-41]|uniref:Nuclear transport factor 2 family protein n=1 Tax=Speluncibacter jeojiensis TaxID=2710754 RepID=A0A9X4LZA5_9ACTN|nr:nuclear transport factor 2 family protein [Rhodococcus sp. D2-41]MDG3011524.1 nuclear transport factor 2 family protein [Rhodococcus sp. D2-41]MDG3015118.1 nuclear transport factor 2 family protein [Corynebacteriales bacterium D3-21]